MKQPLVSVIIPTFDRNVGPQNILRDTLRNVLAQSYPNFAITVVDDYSGMPVSQSHADLIAENPKITVIRHHKNLGQAAARKTGVENAGEAEYLAFLDDDDRWKANKLQEQMRFMQEGGYKASITNYELEGGPILLTRRNSTEDPAWLILTGCFLGVASSLLIKRDFFNQVGTFDASGELRRVEDLEWLVRFVAQGHVMAIHPKALTRYRGVNSPGADCEVRAYQSLWERHRATFASNPEYARIFKTAIGWQIARLQLTGGHVLQGMKKLMSVCLQDPLTFLPHFSRYLTFVLKEPVRRCLSGQSLSVEPLAIGLD